MTLFFYTTGPHGNVALRPWTTLKNSRKNGTIRIKGAVRF